MGKEIEGERIILRSLHPSLFESYLMRFSEKIRSILGVDSLEEERRYLYKHYQRMQEGEVHFFCIFLKKKNELIGGIEIRSAEFRGNFYGWIHEQFWSQGLFQDALRTAVHYYFEKYPHEFVLTAWIDESNHSSLAVFERVGFLKHLKHKGPREDQWELIYLKMDSCSLSL